MDRFQGEKDFQSRRKIRLTREEKSSDLPESSGGLVTVFDPANPVSEAYRTLRTSLLYSLVDTPPKVIVLTSAGPGEGKSITCANLGVVLAQADMNTLILDCDFRKPTLHTVFELRNLRGVTNALVQERSPQEIWQEPVPGLKVITPGPIPPNPAELLGSRRFAEFVTQLRQQFDYLLIDSPPLELVTDPVILATRGDGVLLVLDAQNTRKGSVRRAVRDLESVGANVLGTVMNNVKTSRIRAYYEYGY